MYKKIEKFHKDGSLSYEKKNFYLVMTCEVPILLAVAAVFWLIGSNRVMPSFCIAIVLFSICITILAAQYNEHKRFAYIYCLFMNFLFIPCMFFMIEGIYFGIAIFFVLGIMITVILIGQYKPVWVFVIIEVIFDALLVVYTYLNNDMVYFEKTTLSQSHSIALSFALVAIGVIYLFLYQSHIHSVMRLSVEKDREDIFKAENTKGRFLANMTHEIRTPMNAIIGMTDLMLKEDLSKDIRENADMIKSASTQLLQIINNILEFSKLDSGSAEIINNVYSFKRLIGDIIADTTSVYASDDIDFHIFIPKDIPDKLFGDEIRIRQVLKYLLYSPLSKNTNGSVNLDISFDYDSDNQAIALNFRIASTGTGLTDDEITAVYNAYSNYDSRQKTDYNRIGLEFSICRKIIEMMNGKLAIESIENIGNSIAFSFMNYVVDEKPVINYEHDSQVAPLIYIGDRKNENSWKRLIEELDISATYVKTPPSFRRVIEVRSFSSIYIPDFVYPEVKDYIKEFGCEDKVYITTRMNHCIGDFDNCKIIRHPINVLNFVETINGQYDASKYKSILEVEIIKYPYARLLCVDDSAVNLKVLENQLKEYDIMPTLVNSGKEALELIGKNEYDLIIVDQKMPEMDGIDLLNNTKKIPNSNKSVPIICATADYGEGIKEELEKVGFTDYLSKPINTLNLEKALFDYLPEELRVKNIIKKASKTDAEKTEQAISKDPLEFSPHLGLINLGGNKDAYHSVLLTYYNEGVQKLASVPAQFAQGDISLYTTNVHALKSSSASVGCVGISPLFKALETAGEQEDIQFIKDNSEKTFTLFEAVLDSVREYLLEEGVLSDEKEEDISENTEVVELDLDIINELSDSISKMNLRRSEEIINDLSSRNFGKDINTVIKKIKTSYENFEYNDIKSAIEELL